MDDGWDQLYFPMIDELSLTSSSPHSSPVSTHDPPHQLPWLDSLDVDPSPLPIQVRLDGELADPNDIAQSPMESFFELPLASYPVETQPVRKSSHPAHPSFHPSSPQQPSQPPASPCTITTVPASRASSTSTVSVNPNPVSPRVPLPNIPTPTSVKQEVVPVISSPNAPARVSPSTPSTAIIASSSPTPPPPPLSQTCTILPSKSQPRLLPNSRLYHPPSQINVQPNTVQSPKASPPKLSTPPVNSDLSVQDASARTAAVAVAAAGAAAAAAASSSPKKSPSRPSPSKPSNRPLGVDAPSLKEKRIREARQFPKEVLKNLDGTTSAEVRKMSAAERELVLYKRKLRNRESARRSRVKRQGTLANLQIDVDELSTFSMRMLDIACRIKDENAQLRKDLAEALAELKGLRIFNTADSSRKETPPSGGDGSPPQAALEMKLGG